MNRLTVLAIVTAVPLALTGCGPIGAGSSDEFQPERSRDITLTVINRNFNDATLYALWENGRRERIGTVSASREETFTLRWQSMELKVEIRLLAAGTSYTQSMMVNGGDELELVVLP